MTAPLPEPGTPEDDQRIFEAYQRHAQRYHERVVVPQMQAELEATRQLLSSLKDVPLPEPDTRAQNRRAIDAAIAAMRDRLLARIDQVPNQIQPEQPKDDSC